MLIHANQSALVLIDLQQKLLPALHQHEAVLAHSVRMAAIAGLLGLPVIGTEQMPDKLGPNHPEVRRLCDKTLSKAHFDACADGLPAALPGAVKQIVIGGCEAHICLLQTALSLIARGYQVFVLLDCCSSRSALDRDAAFERLRQAGAIGVTVEMVAYEWLRDSRHPLFRDILKLVK
ncbi:isochorismatase family protein [Herbaspirillum sp. YR522]|uniref:isochorismatase family protein n=1 Tax=Herbaspirillum sp. YR522 TaxID=1144342 RepID=UPI00026F535C|nr:isochorismatase family protein [Herbaspirillum sp. YR522]EJN08411.1 nicotinamidase-like amidase [Herbaspirillum sp. YR522]